MLAGLLALIAAALFTGAAFYINFAEHPARMLLPVKYALRQWQPSYKRGFAMQATLAVVGGICAFLQWYVGGGGVWLAGGMLLVANWPFTMLVIMPVNHRLIALDEAADDSQGTALMQRWNQLHTVRTILGTLSVGTLLLGAMG